MHTNTFSNSGFSPAGQSLKSGIYVRTFCYTRYKMLTRTSDLKTADAIIKKLLYVTPNRQMLYVTDVQVGMPTHVFEHLSCFLPGLLALGAATLDLSAKDKELHQWAAKGLAYSCWISYADQPTGLGPDVMLMKAFPHPENGSWVNVLERWEQDGKPGGVPPGLGEYEPEHRSGFQDYSAQKTSYLLRPEVTSDSIS